MSESEQWRADLVGPLEGDILEIGVGAGDALPYYRKARHIWAIEPDARRADEARAAAREISIPVTIEVAPAESIPFPDASFDSVVSSMVFCSVDDPATALAEIKRVLRPGGVLHMREHVRPDNALLAGVAHLLTPIHKRLFQNCHLDRPTVETLRANGWKVDMLSKGTIMVRLRATPP